MKHRRKRTQRARALRVPFAARFEAVISWGLEARLTALGMQLGLEPGQNAALLQELATIGERFVADLARTRRQIQRTARAQSAAHNREASKTSRQDSTCNNATTKQEP